MRKERIFKERINLEKERNYIPNGSVFESIELEYFKEHILEVTLITNEELPRVFKLNFIIGEEGEFNCLIDIETEMCYKISSNFKLDSRKLKPIFKYLYDNSKFDNFDEECLINHICSLVIPFAIEEEAEIRFHNEEDRYRLLNRNLDLYLKTMDSNENEMSMILSNINYIMSTEAMASLAHIYDVHVARPFGPSVHIQEELEYFKERISEYNRIFEVMFVEGKSFLDYLLTNSDRFVQIYKEMTTVYADYAEGVTINYLTLSNSGSYLVNKLNYRNKEDLEIRKFLKNNAYSCLVRDVDFETDSYTFDCLGYAIYHIGNSRDNYIELHIKETDTTYYIKSCKDNKVFYEFKISKEDLKDKVLVFTNKGYSFSDSAIIVDDNTFKFNVLDTDYTKPIGFNDITEYYNSDKKTKNINLRQLDSSIYKEEKVETYPPSIEYFDEIDDEDIPF